jgi:SAM-dependent methyltransferase
MRMRVLRFGIRCSFVILALATVSLAQQPRVSDFKNDLAPYVGSPQHAVERMLEMANLKPGETLYDLGCGDGRILIAAAQRYKIKAVGVEISEHLAKEAAAKVKKEGLQNSVRIIHGNLLETDLTTADVVTLYLNNSANESLRPNLERYLRPHTRVVSYDYPIPGWKAIDTSDTEGHSGDMHTIYLYEVPNSITKK